MLDGIINIAGASYLGKQQIEHAEKSAQHTIEIANISANTSNAVANSRLAGSAISEFLALANELLTKTIDLVWASGSLGFELTFQAVSNFIDTGANFVDKHIYQGAGSVFRLFFLSGLFIWLAPKAISVFDFLVLNYSNIKQLAGYIFNEEPGKVQIQCAEFLKDFNNCYCESYKKELAEHGQKGVTSLLLYQINQFKCHDLLEQAKLKTLVSRCTEESAFNTRFAIGSMFFAGASYLLYNFLASKAPPKDLDNTSKQGNKGFDNITQAEKQEKISLEMPMIKIDEVDNSSLMLGG